MLFDDNKNHLDITITPLGRNKKILTIKKADYMTSDYEEFIAAGLVDTNIASHLLIAQDVSISKDNNESDAAVGIIIQGLRANEEVVKYLVNQLDNDFCGVNGIGVSAPTGDDLISRIEDMIPTELKTIDRELTLSEVFGPIVASIGDGYYDEDDDDFDGMIFEEILSSFGTVGMVGGGFYPCSGIVHGGSLIPSAGNPVGHSLDVPICPNIGLSMLVNLFKETYSEYLRFSFKSDNSLSAGDNLKAKAELKASLLSISKELADNSKYIRDCLSCPHFEQCH